MTSSYWNHLCCHENSCRPDRFFTASLLVLSLTTLSTPSPKPPSSPSSPSTDPHAAHLQHRHSMMLPAARPWPPQNDPEESFGKAEMSKAAPSPISYAYLCQFGVEKLLLLFGASGTRGCLLVYHWSYQSILYVWEAMACISCRWKCLFRRLKYYWSSHQSLRALTAFSTLARTMTNLINAGSFSTRWIYSCGSGASFLCQTWVAESTPKPLPCSLLIEHPTISTEERPDEGGSEFELFRHW